MTQFLQGRVDDLAVEPTDLLFAHLERGENDLACKVGVGTFEVAEVLREESV
jgi:hypothetical protein